MRRIFGLNFGAIFTKFGEYLSSIFEISKQQVSCDLLIYPCVYSNMGSQLKLAIVCLTGGRWLWLKRRLTIAVLQSCKTLDKVARRQSILSWRGLPGSVWPCLAPLPLLIIAWRHLLIRNCWQDGEMWGLVYWFLVQAHRRLPCCTGDSRGLITAAPFKL